MLVHSLKSIDMYYLGSPFVDEKKIIILDDSMKDVYYRELNITVSFASKIIERINNGTTDLVFYIEADRSNEELKKFHKERYKDLLMFIENRVSDYGLRTETVVDFKLKGIKISHYDQNWLLQAEQVCDGDFKLIEYHKFSYKPGSRVWHEEKIFFADQWVIHTEDL